MIVKNFIIKNFLFTLLLILPVSAGINFVQQNNKTLNPSGSSVVVAYPNAQTAGNSNIVVVGWNDTSAAVKSVTDSRGNSYALAVGPTAGKALTQSIYYANKIAGGSNTVTVPSIGRRRIRTCACWSTAGLTRRRPWMSPRRQRAIHKMEIAVPPRPLR